MVIIEILWHIKKGTEDAFLEAWRTKFTVSDRSKLIGEFLSHPNDTVEDRFKTWRVEEFGAPPENVAVFVNVALWESFEDFKVEISKHIPQLAALKPDFEVARYRIVLDPVAWKIGKLPFPTEDSPGVR